MDSTLERCYQALKALADPSTAIVEIEFTSFATALGLDRYSARIAVDRLCLAGLIEPVVDCAVEGVPGKYIYYYRVCTYEESS